MKSLKSALFLLIAAMLFVLVTMMFMDGQPYRVTSPPDNFVRTQSRSSRPSQPETMKTSMRKTQSTLRNVTNVDSKTEESKLVDAKSVNLKTVDDNALSSQTVDEKTSASQNTSAKNIATSSKTVIKNAQETSTQPKTQTGKQISPMEPVPRNITAENLEKGNAFPPATRVCSHEERIRHLQQFCQGPGAGLARIYEDDLKNKFMPTVVSCW